MRGTGIPGAAASFGVPLPIKSDAAEAFTAKSVKPPVPAAENETQPRACRLAPQSRGREEDRWVDPYSVGGALPVLAPQVGQVCRGSLLDPTDCARSPPSSGGTPSCILFGRNTRTDLGVLSPALDGNYSHAGLEKSWGTTSTRSWSRRESSRAARGQQPMTRGTQRGNTT